MSFKEKLSQLLTALIKLTLNDEIQWEATNPPDSITKGTDDIVPIYYETKYKDNHIAVYEQRIKWFHADIESFYWSEREVFAVLDNKKRILWKTGEFPAIVDLLNTVKEKSIKIDDLLSNLIDQ